MILNDGYDTVIPSKIQLTSNIGCAVIKTQKTFVTFYFVHIDHRFRNSHYINFILINKPFESLNGLFISHASDIPYDWTNQGEIS